MNVSRIFLAGFGGTVAYFVLGGIVFGALPMLRNEFAKYPAVYRSQDSMKSVMPIGMLGIFVSVIVLAVLFASLRQNHTAMSGARFGMLIGLFAIGGFVLHNHVNLNIGLKLTLQQAVAYFLEWTLVGIVIGVIYKPR